MSANNKVILRNARTDDLTTLWPLCSKYFTSCENSSYEDFVKLWEYRWNSPARAENDPLGWVLEDEQGRVKGFLANIPLMIRSGAELIKGYAASTWVAEPSVRKNSLDLFRRFRRFSQNTFLLDATASFVASRVCKRLGLTPIHTQKCQQRYLWVMDPVNYLKAIKSGRTNIITKIILTKPFLYLAVLFFSVYLYYKKSEVYSNQPSFKFLPVKEFDHEYDMFWDSIKLGLGIVHERKSGFMNWRHINLPYLNGGAFPFVCKDKENHALGYLVCKTAGANGNRAKQFIITEILFAEGRQDVFLFMVAEAYKFARKQAAASLEVFGFNEDLMEGLLQFKPLVAQQSYISYWFLAPPQLKGVKKFWLSAVDGDLNL
ncbi:hypothetical protein ACFL5U_01455 [Candidatus Margulisiibacteriota bacterium]